MVMVLFIVARGAWSTFSKIQRTLTGHCKRFITYDYLVRICYTTFRGRVTRVWFMRGTLRFFP